jgi:hypothetical protein
MAINWRGSSPIGGRPTRFIARNWAGEDSAMSE